MLGARCPAAPYRHTRAHPCAASCGLSAASSALSAAASAGQPPATSSAGVTHALTSPRAPPLCQRLPDAAEPMPAGLACCSSQRAASAAKVWGGRGLHAGFSFARAAAAWLGALQRA